MDWQYTLVDFAKTLAAAVEFWEKNSVAKILAICVLKRLNYLAEVFPVQPRHDRALIPATKGRNETNVYHQIRKFKYLM